MSEGFGDDSIPIHEERLQISDAGRKQNESILRRFSTQFSIKESFNFYLLYKLRKFSDISRNSLATKKR